MSFNDPTMINNKLPEHWNDYDLHVEVNVMEYYLIEYLEKTKWVYFADGGIIYGNVNGMDNTNRTRWYGLKKEHKIRDEQYKELLTNFNGLLLSRSEMLDIARTKINSHFLTEYKTHDEIMANKITGSAMIGFMKCWEWLKQ